MKLNAVTSNINYQPNFTSTYPVVHWVAEANGSYAPISNLKLVKKLQSKIIRVLNVALSETEKPMNITEQKLRAYIGTSDLDYRNKQEVRSFYDRISFSPQYFIPISYIISGKDVEKFNELLAKKIGKSKRVAISNFSNAYSQETIDAINTYNHCGLEYVNNKECRIKDKNNMTYVLHTKFEIIRNKLGKIKDYKFQDARFLPEYGPSSPFTKI